ncbi:hypothetical protein MK280_03465, partial [Myxococcota bacterium]|nr:hypothetical protein [Myxococcota bacterium]
MTLNPAGYLADRLTQLEAFEAAQRVVDGISQESRASVAEISAAARIRALARSHSDLSGVGLKRIDAALRQIKMAIARRTLELALDRFEDALQDARVENRGGMLALLEILIDPGAGVETGPRSHDFNRRVLRIVVYLCRAHEGSSARVTCDPVFLSPSFHTWCSEAESVEDSEARDLELEFFAGANLELDGLSEPNARERRQRLIDSIGAQVFEPRVLRAVVTYEIALASMEVPAPVVDPSVLLASEGQGLCGAQAQISSSVFSSEPLRLLGDSLNDRLRGAPCATTPEGRIAWGLDLSGLRSAEREALRSAQLATAKNPLGTTILVGLLGRQEKILGVELQELGVPPANLLGSWREELANVLQDEIHAALKREAYGLSCAISDVKARFLGEGGAVLSNSELTSGASEPGRVGLKMGVAERAPDRAESARSLVEAALREPTVSSARGRGKNRSVLGRLGLVVVLGLAAG